MSLPVLSLLALLAVVVAGSFLPVNVGVLAIAAAFLIGVPFAGLKASAVGSGFPAGLFLTLVGVTLLFSQARVNGTLDRISALAVSHARGKAGVIPIIFFLLALGFASIGPGNIASTALLAPVAMAAAGRAGIPAFLMAMMVCCGANAGALSPFAPTGIIANGLMGKIGIEGAQLSNYLSLLVSQAFVGFAGYFLLGGTRLLREGTGTVALEERGSGDQPLEWQQKLTLAVIAALIVAVLVFKVDITIGAFVGAAVLSLARAADEKEALRSMPWSVVLMVCGVTVLIGVADKTGGMDLLTSMLSSFSTQQSITAVIALVTGVISVYSSSSGVVLPAFLPTIPGLIEKLGGGDALAIASSINVGAHLVDVSPLSTLGALCISNAAPDADRKRLFNQMLVWGLSMCVVGAVVCYVFFGVF
ncbi:MAG TPA: SLC13 family permease [Burkholderiales bacterium]|jgi:di/tricarboxylate transporter|nr:SLC13 family permease [Burkholderiales bacterium]